MLRKLKKIGNKAKALTVIGATAVAVSSSQAAITFDEATKKFSGEIDMGTYYSGVEIAIGVVAVTLSVGLFFAILKRARG
ncbi:hypothetical protein [Arcobacter porcinus]|uniref:Uncharacterized protein n=1 Tax=Arcobacter porcinus TaxID=1935204 RepID=A0A5C2HEP5_9BACT|nr:hypothetical protein [Arcobacter porcinus]OCL96784.1 hypothetical protein AAX27_00416 [Aliarcobacter thereius]QEP40614.1 hypothetical protein APORC_1012 [Arcobacter porcinus]